MRILPTSFRSRLILTLAAMAVLCAGVGAYFFIEQGRKELPPGAIELVLTTDRTEYALGEVPRVNVRLVNKSGRTIDIVRPSEGSSMGMSMPTAKFDVIQPPSAYYVPQIGHCGMIAGVHKNSFVTLPKDASIVIAASLDFKAQQLLDCGPGAYDLVFTYSTNCEVIEPWLGTYWRPDPDDADLRDISTQLQDVPLFTAVSNTVTVNYTSSYEDPLDVLSKGRPYEAASAVHSLARIAPNDRTREHAQAVLSALEKNYNPTGDSYHEFVSVALPYLAETITPNDADLAIEFWNLVSREKYSQNHRVFFDQSEPIGSSILAIMLQTPIGMREPYLMYLLHNETSPNNANDSFHPVPLTLSAMLLLYETPGEDIDRVLLALSRQPYRFGGDNSALYKGLVEEANRRGLALPELARL